jgi:hypothetical protein
VEVAELVRRKLSGVALVQPEDALLDVWSRVANASGS